MYYYRYVYGPYVWYQNESLVNYFKVQKAIYNEKHTEIKNNENTHTIFYNMYQTNNYDLKAENWIYYYKQLQQILTMEYV